MNQKTLKNESVFYSEEQLETIAHSLFIEASEGTSLSFLNKFEVWISKKDQSICLIVSIPKSIRDEQPGFIDLSDKFYRWNDQKDSVLAKYKARHPNILFETYGGGEMLNKKIVSSLKF